MSKDNYTETGLEPAAIRHFIFDDGEIVSEIGIFHELLAIRAGNYSEELSEAEATVAVTELRSMLNALQETDKILERLAYYE